VKRACLAALVGMFAAACGSRSVSYQVQIIGVACTSDPSTSPFPSTGTITLTVTGDGIAKPLTASYDLGAGAGQINNIPSGTNRVIGLVVTSSGQTVSVGQSLPFNVPDAVPSPNVPIQVTVFARRVSVFTQTNLAAAPTTCSTMMSPRAGHTATLLQDGRVFIAGGFVLDGGSLTDGGEAIALASTEIYDPTTGAFSAGGTMQVPDSRGNPGAPLPRAFHSATLMPSGLVLLAGGEWYRDGATLPLQGALVFGPSQPSNQAFGGIEMNAPRTRLGAAVDASGRVIVFGGYGAGGNVNDTVEWWDPNDPTTWTGPFYKANIMAGGTGGGPFSLPLVGMSVAPVAGGNQIAVLGGLAGGLDGGAQQVSGAITYFSYDGGTFRATQAASPLLQPTSSAAVAPFIDASRVILAGGYDGTASGFLQVVTSSGSVTQQPTTLATARGDLCAAALADGRVLTAGGRTFQTGMAQSLGTVELIANNGGTAAVLPQQALPTPRSNHTCTTLKDGSVLILGGMNEQNGQQTVLQDALIYMPQPTTPPPN
jgi:hypothetical protein